MTILEYPTELAQWFPVPKKSDGLSKEDLGRWATQGARTWALLRGEDPGEAQAMLFARFLPSPEDVDRIVFLPTLGGPAALAEFTTTAVAADWRENLIAQWTSGPPPSRPIEIDDIELGDWAESFRLVYASYRDDRFAVVLGFAGIVGDTVVAATAYANNAMTAIEIGGAMPTFIGRITFADEPAPV